MKDFSVWQVLNTAREKTLRDSSVSVSPRCHIRDVLFGVTGPTIGNDAKCLRQFLLDLFLQVDECEVNVLGEGLPRDARRDTRIFSSIFEAPHTTKEEDHPESSIVAMQEDIEARVIMYLVCSLARHVSGEEILDITQKILSSRVDYAYTLAAHGCFVGNSRPNLLLIKGPSR